MRVDVGWIGTLLLVLAGCPVAIASIYLLLLALAALRRPAQPQAADARSRVVVLVPAHNEVELLPRCIRSLRTQNYPEDQRRIVVIADNCTDGTARVARAAGAEVMVRDEPGLRGKGQALRWAMDRVLTEPLATDAVAVVDADSVADRGMLRALERALTDGAEAAQADYVVLDAEGGGAALRQAAFLLFHRTRFAGRSALGLPCSLVGNGMMFRRSLLGRLPWNAFTGVEDLEYSLDLRLAGVRPRFVPAARVAGPAPTFGAAAATQRMRWEGGRFHLVRTRLPRLLGAAVRRHDLSLAEAALDLAIPPLGLLTMASLVGDAGSLAAALAGVVHPWAGATWWAASLLLTGYVMVGLRAAEAPPAAYRALLQVPHFLAAKIGTYLHLTRGLGADRWERSQRPGDAARPTSGSAGPPALLGSSSASGRPARVNVCGVPIDAVDQDQAVERMMRAVGSAGLLQVSTVNLQFLVTARRRSDVRQALGGTGLNVADGAPVMWLARILGRPLPQRVAGADLVPNLMRAAAAAGARVYLLGGADGVGARAATVLRSANPGLIVAGTDAPAVAPLEAMDDQQILSRIAAAGADILLVGFGHPKQDLWIWRNRDRLPVSVAIGVGGTFDLIAGRLRRAPLWARGRGLEWLFRLAQEPRRLALRYATCGAWLLGVLMPGAAWQRLMRATVFVGESGAEPFATEPSQERAAP